MQVKQKTVMEQPSDNEFQQRLVLAKKQVEAYNNRHGKDTTQYPCPKCKNKRLIYVLGEQGDIRSKQCDCVGRIQAIKSLQHSGKTELMTKCTLKNYEDKKDFQKQIKQLATQYVGEVKNGSKDWFYLGGQSGIGKTHICSAIFKQFFNGYTVGKYMIWHEEINKFIDTGFAGAEEKQKKIEELKNADVLYIDDLFKTRNQEVPTRQQFALTFEIINARYNKQLTTILSSEVNINKIIDNFDEALGSRIYEMCGNGKYILNIKNQDGRNYRLKNIQEI